jgi:hypothetical protein
MGMARASNRRRARQRAIIAIAGRRIRARVHRIAIDFAAPLAHHFASFE